MIRSGGKLTREYSQCKVLGNKNRRVNESLGVRNGASEGRRQGPGVAPL